MNSFLEKISQFIYGYHKHILIASIIISVLSLALMLNIEIKTDIMDVLPADNPSLKLFDETVSDFKRKDALTIVIESKNSKIVNHIEFIDSIGRRLSESPLIEYVDYNVLNMPWDSMLKYFPFYLDEKGFDILNKRLTDEGINSQISQNYRTLASPLSSIADVERISIDPLNIGAMLNPAVTGESASGIDFSTGYYFIKDHTIALMFLTPDGSIKNIAFVKALEKEIKSIIDEALKTHGSADVLDIGYAGAHAILWETHESMLHDMISTAVITFVIVLFIFLFIYKSRLIALPVILLTLLISLIWTLTAAYLLFDGLNIITGVVSAMLIGLGIDYTLHIYDRYVMEFKRHKEARLALKFTLVNTGKSVITSGITTSFAFFSIVVTSFRGLHELGIIAGIGIISCMISTIAVMGAMLVWISTKNGTLIISHKNNLFLEKTVPDFIAKKGTLFLIVLGVFLLFAISGTGRLKFNSDVSEIGLKDSRAINLQKRLSGEFGRKENPLIATYGGSQEIDEVFDKLEKKLHGWKDNGITGGHTSLGSLIPPPFRQKIAIKKLQDINGDKINIEESFVSALNKYGFTVKSENISYIKGINEVLKINKPFKLNEFLKGNNRKAGYFYNTEKNRLAAFIYPEGEQWDETSIKAIKNDLESMGEGWQLTGWQLVSGELKESIIKESIIAALISFGFILTIIYFHFKKAFSVLFAQMPLLCGFIITLGIMGYANIEFNHINIAAIAMLFGISVDYGVYVMQAFSENRHFNDKNITRHAFKNIIICSLTTVAGFGSLVTTNFRGIASLGLVITIGVMSSLLVSIALFPISERFSGWRR